MGGRRGDHDHRAVGRCARGGADGGDHRGEPGRAGLSTEIEAIFLFAAAFAAGAINSVAGGGSLVSFPALLAVGVPSKAANITNTVALWPGYASGSLAYREELRHQGPRVVALLVPSLTGALAGSVILLATPSSAFDALVPWLILFGCAMMAFQGPMAQFAERHRLHSTEAGGRGSPVFQVSMFLLAVYGAYFGAGLGIMILAVLLVLLPDDIQHSNALKGLLSLVINAVAVVYFAAFGPVRWWFALVMALGAIGGGYFGVGIARRLGPVWLRRAVVAYGLVVVGVLFAT